MPHLGAFSISLSVKDIGASRAFYEKLGFSTMGDYSGQGWMILQNGDTVIGLFQGMFEQNMLTFNPGWNQSAEALESFDDVRALHAAFTAAGLETMQETGLDADGPASFLVMDPDGNPVLIDQHVSKPG